MGNGNRLQFSVSENRVKQFRVNQGVDVLSFVKGQNFVIPLCTIILGCNGKKVDGLGFRCTYSRILQISFIHAKNVVFSATGRKSGSGNRRLH